MRTKRTEKEFYAALGLRIRIAREMKGLHQGQVGHMIGLTRTSIVNIEAGKQSVPLHTFVKLADALGVAYKLLLMGQSERGRQ
jgi:transcriptional regulator with XRE-family HTH domain